MIIEQKIMKSGYKINKVTFQIREGDKANNSNECAIGGKWIDKTTDDFFKNIEILKVNMFGPVNDKIRSIFSGQSTIFWNKTK